MLKATWGVGGKAVQQAKSLSGKKELLKSTTDKTNNTSDNNQQSESTHNNSLNLNSISDVNQAIEQTRSSKDNYTKKLEKSKQFILDKHL